MKPGQHNSAIVGRLLALATLGVWLAPLAVGLAVVSTAGPILTSCCHTKKGCCCRTKGSGSAPAFRQTAMAEKCPRSCAAVSSPGASRLGVLGTPARLVAPAPAAAPAADSSGSSKPPARAAHSGRAPPLA